MPNFDLSDQREMGDDGWEWDDDKLPPMHTGIINKLEDLFNDNEWKIVKTRKLWWHEDVSLPAKAGPLYGMYHHHKRKLRTKKRWKNTWYAVNEVEGECARCRKKVPPQLLMLFRLLSSTL